MMKKKFTSVAAIGLCLALGFSMGVSADSRKVVTLGAGSGSGWRVVCSFLYPGTFCGYGCFKGYELSGDRI